MKSVIFALAPVVLATEAMLGGVADIADIQLPADLDLPELPAVDVAELTRLAGLANPTQITALPTGVAASLATQSIIFPDFPGFKLPEGIELPKDIKPKEPICEGCTSVYHPAHPGVDIDGCDNDEANGWHWVHPGTPIHTDQPPYGWVTSTVTEVHTSTIIDCKPEVKNCPGDSTLYTTVHVPATVTICPAPKDTAAVPTLPIDAGKPYESLPSNGQPIYTAKPKPVATDAYPEEGQVWTAIPKPSLIPGTEAGVPGKDEGLPTKEQVKIHLEEIQSYSATPMASATGAYIPAVSQPPYPACGNTLCPEVIPGTGVAHPPFASPTGAVVTAGAPETVKRAGLAVLAGLLVAII